MTPYCERPWKTLVASTLVKTPDRVSDSPRAEYTRRLDERRNRLARESIRDRVLTESRLVIFLAGLVVAGLIWWARILSPAWLGAPIGLFLVVLIVHSRVIAAVRRAKRAVELYERGLDRLDGRWSGRGVSGDRFLDPEHPFAADLDLFGTGSVFERLCTARTGTGEETLAHWLLEPAPPGVVSERHASIDELRPRLDLREDLELLGSDVRAGIDPQGLVAWGNSPRVFQGAGVRIAAAVVSGLAVGALVLWIFFPFGLYPAFLMLLVLLGVNVGLATRVHGVVAGLDKRTHDLVLLSELLARVEREPFENAALRRLREALGSADEPASRRIAELARLMNLRDMQENQFFLPIAVVLLWNIQFAAAIDAWRGRFGPEIGRWLEAVGEFEALCALASYAWENPIDPFPELEADGARFEAEALGHALIPEATCVRNDVRLGLGTDVFVVSGSNMSGKSTLLRSVGVNAVLAFAGAPVKARRLRISPLSLGATLRVQDSLQAGRSRFFAEILRLRQIVDLARSRPPVLFLLDEILHGTNSHDRLIGAEAVVRGLVDLGAVGLVTTHDLALAGMVDRMAGRAANVHFEDQFAEGTLKFDYRMRPGVVQHSNALALMRSVGLEV
jgi:hypothetical protein